MGYKLKRIMMRPNGVEKQVRPDTGWKPGENTIAYFPLNNDYVDYSGNGVTLTVYGDAPTYSTLPGNANKKYGYFTTNTTLYSSITIYSQCTLNTWVRVDGNADWMKFFGLGSNYSGTKILSSGSTSQNRPRAIDGFGPNFSTTILVDTNWHNVVGLINGSSVELYLDGVSIGSGTLSTNVNGVISLGGMGASHERFVGCLSECIYENKIWTSDEISEYYNQTKADYGL